MSPNKLPGVVEFADFATFDYNTLHPNNWFFNFFAQPWVPFVSVLLYLVLSKPAINALMSTLKIAPDSKMLKAGIILHSGLLAVYSGWTFVNSFLILARYYNDYGGVFNTICGSKATLWDNYGMGFWITHFYISKYYEFVDTWIVLAKGRTPMFLQTYHHAGVVIIMWMLGASYATPVVVLVLLNSFIHTLMYTYYTLAAFGYSSPLKSYLTSMQIIQFVVGISITIPAHWIAGADGSPCVSPAGSASLLVLQLYTVVLIGLFAQFYVQSYTKKVDKGKGSTKKVE